MQKHNPRRGFTLMEMSIVAVLISLLLGAIVTGQVLVRQAELRSVGRDIEMFIAATGQFKTKYMGLPGDITDATSIWGAANADPATCRTSASVGKETCNGNGNDAIDDGSNEMFRFWQQLAASGFINGNFTGVAGPGNAYDTLAGTNAPMSKIDQVSYLVRHGGTFGDASAFYRDYGEIMAVGLQETAPGAPHGKFLTPTEAQGMDRKFDDGKPAQGKFVAYYFSSCTSAAVNTDLDATYKTTDSDPQCSFLVAGAL